MRRTAPLRCSNALLALALLGAQLPLGCGSEKRIAAKPAAGTRPDVLLVTIDTLRADHLGVYGFPHGSSPEIDALAAQAVVFERAIAGAGRTVPAHATIFTSRYTRGHSVGHLNGRSTLRGQETLADHFLEAGYATGGFVGNILLTHRTGLGRGFEHFDDDLETPERNRPHVVERLAEQTTQRAIAWLAGVDGDRPLFLWVHYQDPHGPYTPPAEDAARFTLRKEPGERRLRGGKDNRGRGRIPSYQAIPGLHWPSEYRSRYVGEIFYADRAIGDLVAAFDARGPDRDKAILLTADHGESFGENGRYFIHTYTTTPEIAQVPFVLRAPGVEPGRRSEIVHHIDVLPTLLAIAGLALPGDARGVSLLPLLQGADLPERWVYCDNGGQLSAYRDDAFLRIQGLEGAWSESSEAGPSGIAPRSERFVWSSAKDWKRMGPAQVELPDEIREYASQAVPMVDLPPPDPEQIEQLRALGYVD